MSRVDMASNVESDEAREESPSMANAQRGRLQREKETNEATLVELEGRWEF